MPYEEFKINDSSMFFVNSDGIAQKLCSTVEFQTTIDSKWIGGNKMRKIYHKEMLRKMGIAEVIHNDDATIVILKDGRKGVAVRDKNESEYTPFGFAMAYAYAMGTDGNKSQFKKNIKKIIK